MTLLVDVAAAVRPDKPSRQMLAGWAGVMILLGVVDEVLPGEQAALGVARCQCLWHNLLAARGLLCRERHGRKLMAVVPLIGHLVGHDQMVLGVDGDLHIVADMAVP